MSQVNEQLVRTFLAGTSRLVKYLEFIEDDCSYRVANQSIVLGKQALAEAAGRFRAMGSESGPSHHKTLEHI